MAARLLATAAVDFWAWCRANRLPWVVGAWAAILLVVGAVHNPAITFGAARATYFLVAVYALQVMAGETGTPSLGHAAFLALGAYGTAFLRLRVGLDGLVAALAAAAAAAAVGWLLGHGITRLRTAFLVLLTWTLGWVVYLSLGAFPELSGGVAGISFHVPMRVRWDWLGIDIAFTDAGHLALGTVVLGFLLLLYRSAQTSTIGLGWAALKDSPSLAMSLGRDVAATRRRALAVSAALTALAGALGAELVGVVDPTAYSPTTSLGLLAAVLIGGPLGFFGPVIGALVTGGAPFAVDQAAAALGVTSGSGRQLGAAALTILALGVSAAASGRYPRRRHQSPAAPVLADADVEGGQVAVTDAEVQRGQRAVTAGTPALVARDLRVAFEGVQALDGVSITVAAGTIHGLIGPNGSGKSTLLRCIAGTTPYDGTVRLSGEAVDGTAEHRRVRLGLSRTFQRTAVMTHLRARQHVEVGLVMRAVKGGRGGWARALFRTPGYREEIARGHDEAMELLAQFGLADAPAALASSLGSGGQRLLQIATAAATRPRVLLLDEPAAGLDTREVAVLEAAIRDLAASGVALLLIEHNLTFLSRVASRVTVLEAGHVLFEGSSEEAAASPEVRRAYLGRDYKTVRSKPRSRRARATSVPRPRPRRV